MARISRRGMIKSIGVAGTVGLAGCLEGLEDAGTAARIGILQPESGDLGDLGTPIADAAELPVRQLEDAGVGYELESRREDTETEPDVAVDRAQALVDSGYPTITGAAASPSTINAAEDVFFPNEVVAISPASTSPAITDMPGEYLLRTAPSDAWQGDAMAEIAVEQEGADTVSTLFLNNDYGQGLNDTFVAGVEDRGGEVFEEVAFEPEQPSYTSQLDTALADDPDLLMVVGYPESGEVLFRDFYSDFDTDITILVPDGLIDDSLPANVDNAMENVMGTAPSARGPGRDAFMDMYEDEFGDTPGVFNGQAYDATAVLILASLAAGELDGPAIADEIRNVANPGGEVVEPGDLADGLDMAADGEEIQYQGASGPVEFDDNGDQRAVTYDIGRYDMDGYHVEETVEYES